MASGTARGQRYQPSRILRSEPELERGLVRPSVFAVQPAAIDSVGDQVGVLSRGSMKTGRPGGLSHSAAVLLLGMAAVVCSAQGPSEEALQAELRLALRLQQNG